MLQDQTNKIKKKSIFQKVRSFNLHKDGAEIATISYSVNYSTGSSGNRKIKNIEEKSYILHINKSIANWYEQAESFHNMEIGIAQAKRYFKSRFGFNGKHGKWKKII